MAMKTDTELLVFSEKDMGHFFLSDNMYVVLTEFPISRDKLVDQ